MFATVSVPVTREQVQRALTSALEGGANYWYDDLEAVVSTRQVKLKGDDLDSYWHLREPLTEEGVRLRDVETDTLHILNRLAVHRGLDLLASIRSDIVAEIIGDHGVSDETSDIFLQLCLFDCVHYAR